MGTATCRSPSRQIDPIRSITYRWGDTKSPVIDPVASTVFTYTLEEVDGGTQLHVVETGFQNLAEPARALHDNQEGWTSELNKLVDLRGGRVMSAVPNPPRVDAQAFSGHAHGHDRRARREGVGGDHRARAHRQWSGVRRRAWTAVAVGGHGAWVLRDRRHTPITIEAIDAASSISYRWAVHLARSVDPVQSTVFTFTLEAVAGGTRLTVVETGFEHFADAAGAMESHAPGLGLARLRRGSPHTWTATRDADAAPGVRSWRRSPLLAIPTRWAVLWRNSVAATRRRRASRAGCRFRGKRSPST